MTTRKAPEKCIPGALGQGDSVSSLPYSFSFPLFPHGCFREPWIARGQSQGVGRQELEFHSALTRGIQKHIFAMLPEERNSVLFCFLSVLAAHPYVYLAAVQH